MDYWKIILPALIALNGFAGTPQITCEPHEMHGLPGEPLQVELTIETDHVAPIQLHIPSVSNLVLRAVEKIPIQRTPAGRYIQKRIIIWQGVEEGSITLTNLTVVFQRLERGRSDRPQTFQPLEKKVPRIGIVIDAVDPATPPENSLQPAVPPSAGKNKTTSIGRPLLRRGTDAAKPPLDSPEVAT